MNLNDERFLRDRIYMDPLGPVLSKLDDQRYSRSRTITPIELLPDELLLDIFLLLDVPSLGCVAQVSKRWYVRFLIGLV